jgi:hypothetical protein
MENFDHILIFSTNIKLASDKIKLQPIFDAHKSIQHWNVDQEDVDHVLRIVSYELKPWQVIELMAHYGYECRELE